MNRIVEIDIAKGLVIILVIVGHTYIPDALLTKLIYSFHMPFFFIVSGWTSKHIVDWSEWRKMLVRSFFKLILPAWVLLLLKDFALIVVNGTQSLNIEYLGNVFLQLIIMPSSAIEFSGVGLTAFTAYYFWFLAAFFSARLVYGLLCVLFNGWKLALSVLTLCVLGIIWRCTWCVMQLDVALATLPFIWIGGIVRQNMTFVRGGADYCYYPQ